ncbi:MAG TPA: flippase [Baekduia sp.]|nr:flippase [Baekduia sp.]
MTDAPISDAIEAAPLSTPTRERAFRDVLVQVVTKVANLAVGIVVTALIVRSLGDVGYGQWMTVLTAYQLIGYFTSLGLEAVTVREAAADPRRAADWVGALLVTRLLLTLPVALVGLVVLLLIQESHAMLIAGLILLVEFPFGVGSSLAVVHQLQVRNTTPMVVLTVNSVLWGLCVLVIYLAGGGLVAMAIALTIVTVITATLQGWFAHRVMPLQLRPSRASIVELIRVGAPLGVAGLLITAYARIDQVIVFEQAGSQAAGFYGSAFRILEQAHFVPASVLTTIAPIVAALYATDRARMLRVVTLASELLAIGALGGLAFAIVAADPFMRLIFGDEFAPAAQALPVLGGAFVFICYGYLSANLLLVLGLAHRQIVVGSIALVINVVGNLILVSRHGFMAAAWMTLATELVVVVIGVWFIARKLGRDSLTLGRLPRILAAALVLFGALEGLDALGAGLGWLALASAVLYPALLLGLRAVAPDEVRALLVRRGGGASPTPV